jgi:hypothetical protein
VVRVYLDREIMEAVLFSLSPLTLKVVFLAMAVAVAEAVLPQSAVMEVTIQA